MFNKNDLVSDAIVGACNRLQMDVRTVRTLESTIDSLQHPITGGYDIIIVDGRLPKIMDPEVVAR